MLAGILAIQSCMGMNIQASEETEQDPFQMIADVSEDLLLTEDPGQAENPVSADNSVPDPEENSRRAGKSGMLRADQRVCSRRPEILPDSRRGRMAFLQ